MDKNNNRPTTQPKVHHNNPFRPLLTPNNTSTENTIMKANKTMNRTTPQIVPPSPQIASRKLKSDDNSIPSNYSTSTINDSNTSSNYSMSNTIDSNTEYKTIDPPSDNDTENEELHLIVDITPTKVASSKSPPDKITSIDNHISHQHHSMQKLSRRIQNLEAASERFFDASKQAPHDLEYQAALLQR